MTPGFGDTIHVHLATGHVALLLSQCGTPWQEWVAGFLQPMNARKQRERKGPRSQYPCHGHNPNGHRSFQEDPAIQIVTTS